MQRVLGRCILAPNGFAEPRDAVLAVGANGMLVAGETAYQGGRITRYE
jgi:hypothetical protein